MKNIYIFNINFEIGQIFLPYVYGCLRAYCEDIPEIKDSYIWKDPIFTMEDPDYMLDKIVDPHVIGLSCYMWNWKKNLYFGREIKKRFPECIIILGGPQAPARSEGFFNEYRWADIIVHNEGEIPFSKILIENLNDNPNWNNIPGISWNNNNKEIKTYNGERIPNIDYKSPYLSGYYEDIIKQAKKDGKKITAFWETNRGCPYSCTFCDWGNGLTRGGDGPSAGKYTQIPTERLSNELNWFSKMEIDDVHNCDSNFGIFRRDLTFTEQITELNEKGGYPRLFAATYAKNSNERVFEISKLIHNHKMSYGTTLSVQSMDDTTLKAIKRDNIGIDRYMELKLLYDKEKIPTYSELILGLPGETVQSWREGFAKLMNAELHDGIMVHPCGFFTNAPMSEPSYKKFYKIKTISRPMWATLQYERGELKEKVDIVVQTKSMTYKDWIEMITYGWMIVIFHGGGATRYLARYLHDNLNISYLNLYSRLYDHFENKPDTILGNCINFSREKYQELIDNPDKNYYAYDKFTIDYKNKEHVIPGGPYNYFWIYSTINLDKFFDELFMFLFQEFDIPYLDEKLLDLFGFQRDLILTPNYDPEEGKEGIYKYNWHQYFYREEPLKRKKNKIIYKDKYMGMHFDKPLVKDDLSAFRWASQAPNGPRPRHYLHQNDRMEIYYD